MRVYLSLRERGGRRLLTALGKLFRTTAFKLSFAYLLVFTIFAFVTLGYVAWSAQRLLTDQFVSTIEAAGEPQALGLNGRGEENDDESLAPSAHVRTTNRDRC